MEKAEARTILRLGAEASASEVQEAYRKRIDEIRERLAAPGQGMRAQYERELAAIGEARDCLLAESGVTDSGRADGREQLPLEPGQLFAGQFELERELQTGITGPVWLAHDYNFRRAAEQVALKFLPDSIVGDSAAAVELKQEILRRVALKHPNILRVVDLLEYHGTVAIQLEYVDGQSLSQLRSTKPSQVFEVRDLKRWMQELCLALNYAHKEMGIVHGDVKPDNLIIGPTGSLKLKDFGIENCIRNAMRRSQAISEMSTSAPYQSPQRAAGEKVTIPDDIYSVGATIYESLTSTPPFYTPNPSVQQRREVLASMAKRRTELGIKGGPIPVSWEETVADCLARDPAQRPDSAREIVRRLETISSPPPILPAPELPEPPGRRTWPLIAGIILLLAIVSAIAFHYFYPAGYNPLELLSPGSPSGSTSVPRPTPSAAPGPKETAGPVLEATANPSPQTMATPSPAASATASTEVRETASPEATRSSSGESNVAAPPEQSASPTQPETVRSMETPSPRASATPLSPSEIDATKEEVVKRIDALPGISAEAKANLIGKMNKAHSMERLVVIPFEIGKRTPSRAAVDELVKTFSNPDIGNKLSDQTTILVVAGYADTGGPPDLNLRISQERAANVSKILKQRLKLSNAIQTVGMGGTELLSNRRPDQNRAVEVWAVAPF
jgi:serine/threonine protein kinase